MKKELIKVFVYIVGVVCIFNMIYLSIQNVQQQETIREQKELISQMHDELNTVKYSVCSYVNDFSDEVEALQ